MKRSQSRGGVHPVLCACSHPSGPLSLSSSYFWLHFQSVQSATFCLTVPTTAMTASLASEQCFMNMATRATMNITTSIDADPESYRRMRTPSPEHIYMYEAKGPRTLPPASVLLGFNYVYCQATQFPQQPQQHVQQLWVPVENSTVFINQASGIEFVPPPPQAVFSRHHREASTATDTTASSGTPLSRSPSSGEVSTADSDNTRGFVEGGSSLPSAGSRGHPFNCGAACKYTTKTRGCKDGDACSHCHLCVWKRGSRKAGSP
jgi:hypothetical protein